jgi:hypothetical protein
LGRGTQHDHGCERLHSATDYVTPADRLAGRHRAIVAERDPKLEAARERRAECRLEARLAAGSLTSSTESLDRHP